MICAVDAALAAINNPDGEDNNMVDFNKIFNGFDPEGYTEEAQQRWGDTDAFRESVNRIQAYTEEDWIKILSRFSPG